MKQLHRVLISSGFVLLVVGLISVPRASADDNHGCYDSSTRCSIWGIYPGTCQYNVTPNACTCLGSVLGVDIEANSQACSTEILVPAN